MNRRTWLFLAALLLVPSFCFAATLAVSNGTGPTNVAFGISSLSGAVTATNESDTAAPTAYICYGMTDQGTNFTKWEAKATFTAQGVGSFSHIASNITPANATFYYRVCAVDAVDGTVWADATTNWVPTVGSSAAEQAALDTSYVEVYRDSTVSFPTNFITANDLAKQTAFLATNAALVARLVATSNTLDTASFDADKALRLTISNNTYATVVSNWTTKAATGITFTNVPRRSLFTADVVLYGNVDVTARVDFVNVTLARTTSAFVAGLITTNHFSLHQLASPTNVLMLSTNSATGPGGQIIRSVVSDGL